MNKYYREIKGVIEKIVQCLNDLKFDAVINECMYEKDIALDLTREQLAQNHQRFIQLFEYGLSDKSLWDYDNQRALCDLEECPVFSDNPYIVFKKRRRADERTGI